MTAPPGFGQQQERALAREIFHDLSQPLTALQCILELALSQDHSAEELRVSLERSLQAASILRQRLTLIRTLDDAYDPGDRAQITELNELMRELCDDMLPLFESEAKQFRLRSRPDAVMVRGERTRLMQALFCFFEYLFQHSSEQSVTTVRVGISDNGMAELRITAEGMLPDVSARV